MKRIWLISKYCRLPGGGIYPARGFSLLREMVRLGHDCTLITARHDWTFKNFFRRSPEEIKVVDGIRVIEIPVIGYTRAKSFARIAGWIQFEIGLFLMRRDRLPAPHVIIASSLSLLSILNALLMRMRRRCKVVFEVRDVWPLVLTENGGFSRRNPLVHLLAFVEWLGYRYADRIVGTMPNLREHVRDVLGYERPVHCIPMGIPEELIASAPKPFPSHLESVFPSGKFVVTHAGSIGIDNALDTLFVAARMLKGDSRIAFFIIGKGDLVDRYKAECTDLPDVRFADSVASEFVQPVLTRSSVLYFAAHPSKVLRYGQSLNKVVDYMYSGRPIVASFTGFPSMVNEAECGVFVPAGGAAALAEQLTRMASWSDDELSRIGLNGRRWLLANRSYRALAEEYLKVLD